MKKTYLLFFPLLLSLACTKSKVIPEEEELPKNEVNMDQPFKILIFSPYEQSLNFKMNDNSGLNYTGFLTMNEEVTKRTFKPAFARLIGPTVTFTDVNGLSLNSFLLAQPSIGTYETAYQTAVNNLKNKLKPKISYEIYASQDITTASVTKVVLALKAVYFYSTLSPGSSLGTIGNNPVDLNQVKESGAYLSRMGHGTVASYTITSEMNPKIYLPYLKAYLDDLINNNGLKTEKLYSLFDFNVAKFTYIGGETAEWTLLNQLSIKESLKKIIQDFYVPKNQPVLSNIEFEYRSIKDDKVLN